MPKVRDCKARQYGDQMSCGKCGLTWDVNDPDPPKCHKVKATSDKRQATSDKRQAYLKFLEKAKL